MRKPSHGKISEEGKASRVSLGERFGESKQGGNSRRNFPSRDINPISLADCVGVVLAAGDGIMFALTRDGGAAVITVFSGEDRRKFYPDDVTSFQHACLQIFDAYSGPPVKLGHVSKPGD